MPPFYSLGMVSYLISIATMAVSQTISKIHQLIGKKSPINPPVSGAPVRGEAVGVKQRPSMIKIRMMELSDGKRISTKRLAALIQACM